MSFQDMIAALIGAEPHGSRTRTLQGLRLTQSRQPLAAGTIVRNGQGQIALVEIGVPMEARCDGRQFPLMSVHLSRFRQDDYESRNGQRLLL